MRSAPDFLRDMRAGEEPGVEALLIRAFDGEEETRLVRALRKAKVIAGEQVLASDGQIVGYFALSRMVAPKGWLCLAPVAIDPDWQGRGHGRRMIGMLSEWARLSKTPVVVLGQVAFYEAAGFSHARAAKLTSPYGTEHLLLAGGRGDDVPEAELVYPKPFAAL